MTRLAIVLLFVAGGCCPYAAYGHGAPVRKATTAEEQAVAMRRFAEGQLAFERRRYEDAIERFVQADHVATSPAFAYNIALAYERIGDVAQALRWSREYLRREANASDRADIEASIRLYERRLADRGLQQVTITSSPDGANVMVDGEPVGVTPWTGEIAPGPHIVDVLLPGREAVRRAFDLDAESSADVHIDLVASRH
jgi:tetratricopeptide (TPR) repeat protein